MRAAPLILIGIAALGACSAPGGPYPSLAPRAAEAIDPRVPVVRPMNDRPVTPALAAELARLVAQARDGDDAFAPAAAQAERMAAGAGSPQSDGWVVAQEAVSGAIAARGPTARAVADIDALAADALQAHAGISPDDLAAIQRAASEAGTIADRQAERINALQRRLER